MKKTLTAVMTAMVLFTGLFAEEAKEEAKEEKIKITGTIDMDVWADMDGNFYNNDDNTLTLEAKLSDKVTGYFGITVVTGGVPAGDGALSARWPGIGYDGAWLSYEVSEGFVLTFGDVLYQYGCFNYYIHKMSSMITKESFIRGVEVTKALGSMELDFMAGALDSDGMAGYALSLAIPFGETMGLDVYNTLGGMRDGTTSPLAAGAEFNGTFGALSLKADFGLNTDIAADSADPSFAVLVEPSVSLGENASVAAAFYYQNDEGTLQDTTFNDMFLYVEPGYSFSDLVAFGLPVEYHEPDADTDDDESLWLVPTLYLYPADGAEIWLWGQMVMPMADGDTEFFVGSELIYEF